MMERARWRVSNGLFVGITLLSALIPLLLSMQFLGTCFAFFVPLFGRAGTLPIGELVLGLMAWYMLVVRSRVCWVLVACVYCGISVKYVVWIGIVFVNSDADVVHAAEWSDCNDGCIRFDSHDSVRCLGLRLVGVE